jgi:hypothetical protein
MFLCPLHAISVYYLSTPRADEWPSAEEGASTRPDLAVTIWLTRCMHTYIDR